MALVCITGSARADAPRGSAPRIVSLDGAVSEILCQLGLEHDIVGVDVTSTYPASLKQKPSVGHNRNISAEGVLALEPTIVIGLASEVAPQLASQLKAAGVKTVLLTRELSVGGVRDMTLAVARAVGAVPRAKAVLAAFDRRMDSLRVTPLNQKILFIYARGAGTMLVGGTGTAVSAIVALAGARNAVTAFSGYKPLNAESLVAADPDVILMFTGGLLSMGGAAGLLKVPGVAQTRAGRDKKIIAMDGELLSGFTLRLPEAIGELHEKLAAE
jgi:iron complex transport system substrate-binding protein